MPGSVPLPDDVLPDDPRRRLGALMWRDQPRLRRRLQQAGPTAGALAQLEAAEGRVAARRAALPSPSYPEDLPIAARRHDIAAAIRDHQVVVVAGETGSGKTTQLPKICLELGRGVQGMIGHTQPRRIAARSVAERIASELAVDLGGAVGYAVRFTDRVSDTTLVKLMTDGILLAELRADRRLLAYDTIIVDEAHERSLNIDFLLGYLKGMLGERPELKVIITSATIDTERFSHHFDNAPIVEVSGRTYPVEIRYQPVTDEADDRDRDQTEAICDAVDDLVAEGPGDILVFLAGERDIRDAADALASRNLAGTEVVPLYARLSAGEQHRVFQTHQGRRIVLATNVAETSLTVPGIRYVVDPGLARISRYSRRTKVQRLPIEAISQASANQRAGRCGRLGPGICVRLYSEEDFNGRPAFSDPEILRTNLASVLLSMASLNLGDVASFGFVDPPDNRQVADGIALLEELGAFSPGADPAHRLTPLGRRLARLPLDPRLGRMVLEAERLGCVAEVAVIATALSIQDPRETPIEHRQAATESHRRFAEPSSDFLSYLNLWRYLRTEQAARSSNQFRKLCRAEYLNFLRVREWQDLHAQIRSVAREMGIRIDPRAERASNDLVHQALLSGLLSHIGLRDSERGDYQGARNARFSLAAGAGPSGARWVMAAELVETHRLQARTVARIRPEWAERTGAHLVQRSYREARWDSRGGAGVVTERVTLYGLAVVAGRRVRLGPVDPELARELFIRHALVEGDWTTQHRFVEENRQRLAEAQEVADRARRRDVLVDDDALFAFYDRRVGPDVVSGRHFDSWWSKTRRGDPGLLDFHVEAPEGVAPLDPAGFPPVWPQGVLALPLSYEFDPGAPDDGVTVTIPLAVLNQVRATGFDWQVPGLRADLVTALIRSLPKDLRRNFVPVPEQVRAFLDVYSAGVPEAGLLPTLGAFLGRRTGVGIPAGSWDLEAVPEHLQIRFKVVSGDETLAIGRDLPALQRVLEPQVRRAVSAATAETNRSDVTRWDMGTLPRIVRSMQGGQPVIGYPALVDEGGRVALRTFPNPAEQRRAHWAGTRRLLLAATGSPLPRIRRQLSNETALALARAPYRSVNELLDDALSAMVDRLIAQAGGPPWDADGFGALASEVDTHLVDEVATLVGVVGAILISARRIEVRLERLGVGLLPALSDIRDQLRGLVFPGFIAALGARRLNDVTRYLEGIERRLDKLARDPSRDAERMRRVQRLAASFADRVATLPGGLRRGDAAGVRWLLEELRISVFAQEVGTAEPVSEERVRRAIAALRP
jgi:ATP-dependent helicase HrpA